MLAEAKAALERVQAEKAQVRAQYRDEIATFEREERRLRGAIRSLSGASSSRARRSAAVQAGPKALDKVRRALARGPLSQAEIVRRTKLNDGTVSYALRALTVELREVEATGYLIGGSREFRIRRARRRAA